MPKRPVPETLPLPPGVPTQCPKCKVRFDLPCRWVKYKESRPTHKRRSEGRWVYAAIEIDEQDGNGPTQYICIECGCRITPDGRKA